MNHPRPSRERRSRADAALAVWLIAVSQAPLVPDADRERMEPQVAEKVQNYRDVVSRSPGSHEAWGDLGTVFQAHGLDEQATQCFERALELKPDDFRWAYLLVHARRAVDRTAALEASARALELGRDYPALLVVRAQLLEERGAAGLDEEAVALYERALELDPANAVAELALGRMALAAGRLDEARTRLERAAELSPDATAVHATLARLYRRAGERELAREAAERASRVRGVVPISDPIHYRMRQESVSSTALVRSAARLEEKGDFSEAESIYRQLVALRPDDASMNVRLGDVLSRQERFEEAKPCYQKALDIDADHPGAHFGLAATLSLDGSYDEAVVHFRRSLAERADHVPTLVSFASTLAFRGDLDEARGLYEKAIAVAPNDVETRRSYAELLFRNNRFAEAAVQFRAAVALEPELGVVHLQLGAALAATGEYESARVHLSRAESLGQTIPAAIRNRVEAGLSREPR